MKKIIAEYDTFKLIQVGADNYIIRGIECIENIGTRKYLIEELKDRTDDIDKYFLKKLLEL